MSIVEFYGLSSWSLDASKTEEGVVESKAGEKNRDTATASLCLVIKGRGRILAPHWKKKLSNMGKYACYALVKTLRWRHVELNADRHLRSHKKIGDCEQSNESVLFVDLNELI